MSDFKLLPPRPSIDDTLKILKLPAENSGIKQLFQHVIFDHLPMYFKLLTYAINVNDERIKQVRYAFGNSVPKLELSSVSDDETHYLEAARVGKSRLSESFDGDSISLWIETFILDGEEYYPLELEECHDSELEKNDLERLDRLEESGIDISYEDMDNIGMYISGYTIKQLNPSLNAFFFYREDIIKFLKDSEADFDSSKKIEKPIKKISLQEQREMIFKVWIKGQDIEKVMLMKKKDVWDILGEINKPLFPALGKDALTGFFNKANFVFNQGRRPKK